jgi:hypothetical protein
MNAHDRWQGWQSGATGNDPSPWIDLSHPLRADLPRIPFFPPARFERVMSMPRDPLNVTEIQMVCHFGTHIDAPCHFIPDGPRSINCRRRLCGGGVVGAILHEPDGVIVPEMLGRLARAGRRTTSCRSTPDGQRASVRRRAITIRRSTARRPSGWSPPGEAPRVDCHA